LIAAMAATGCSRPTQQTRVIIDPALSTLVPADTTLLVGARVDSLAQTAIFDKIAENPVIQDVARRTEIDPKKSLWQLLFASNGQTGMVLARGKFADELMAPDLSAQGIERFGYKGLTMFGNDQEAMLLFNSSTAAIGETGILRKLVDERSSIKGLPERFDALVNAVPKEAQVWGAYAGGTVDLPLKGNLANLTNVLGMVENAMFYATFDEKAHVSATLNANSDQHARDLEGALQALAALSKTSIQVKRDGRRIGATFDLGL
jgi:hypothetical protein